MSRYSRVSVPALEWDRTPAGTTIIYFVERLIVYTLRRCVHLISEAGKVHRQTSSPSESRLLVSCLLPSRTSYISTTLYAYPGACISEVTHVCTMPSTSRVSLRYTSTNGSERRAKPDPTTLGRRYGCLQNMYPAAAQTRTSERLIESYVACPNT